ncbi:UDP-N-acetylgalactosamine-undecaprenyl-phosphate N-acetylgalactosaminephosphotransferase [Rubripirellula amarantea]|uniref:UDP-N-acetylgalactosamine-undecaprenyl-phosphate N-acetylgalactosaminephosphotransferase n=1 Tax=Rubripirellula amarantea TaxID=2527999 RepID=A0A5C5WX55_9BACT|nr:XrtA system polysaccharide deacetylase [Rubripirellula amarantea]TWT54681.1 UDP-N-acetylgalactosamine-undecaprenyl-phosphate N-acetylgalactosaminephosphotransferase [Rubripirellula amarantea]
MIDTSQTFEFVESSYDIEFATDLDQDQAAFFRRKYVLDRLSGTVLLIATSPLVLLLILLVKVTSRGPGLYRQERVGLNGSHFHILKLRSMRIDAEKGGKAVWCVKNDPRVTPLGRLLRKLHLDELPQLVNVARGEMSLVGPRPERPVICKELARQIPNYFNRNCVRPGVTGLAQINLPPDETVDDVRRKQILDLQYIEEVDSWLDLRILFATALRMFGVRGETVTRWMRLCRLHLVAHIPSSDDRQPDTPEPCYPNVATRVAESWNKMPTRVDRFDSSHGTPLNLNPLSQVVSNAFTVDVEDYFQVTAFSNRVSRKNWDKMECRVEDNTDKLLSICDHCEVRGTFYILGWVADRYPDLVRRIADAGHEIASHGYWHQLVYDLTPEEFAEDISNSREAIANACDVVVDSYRAPSFSIVEDSLWALDILVEHGFTTDSSIFPIRGHHRYGMKSARKDIHKIQTENGSINEFPPSLWNRWPLQVPVGGGYFRLFPLSVTSRAIEGVRSQGRPAMFYIHPWELDPQQPRVKNAGRANQFRHYVGLRNTEDRLRRLLMSHPFDQVSTVMAEYTALKTASPATPRETTFAAATS